MEFISHSFRHAEVILNEAEFVEQFHELLSIINSITDKELIDRQLLYKKTSSLRQPKSLSVAINELLKEKFTEKKWEPESVIFQDSHYQGEKWRLDFAKGDISVEVGFNHASVIAWNLIKPVLASELNHVKKAIQTQVGVLITVTEDMKQRGGFDGAIGTFEKYLDYLKPLSTILTSPILLIGISAPNTFYIKHEKNQRGKKR